MPSARAPMEYMADGWRTSYSIEDWDDWEEAVQTVRPSGIYWTRKLAQERRPLQLTSTMVAWDVAIGVWWAMEEDLKLVNYFGHCGSKMGYRKALSYDGTPDGEDKGNWAYAVCLRTMLTLCTPWDWRVVGTKQLNDETAGDILEAIWGLFWRRSGARRSPTGKPPLRYAALQTLVDQIASVSEDEDDADEVDNYDHDDDGDKDVEDASCELNEKRPLAIMDIMDISDTEAEIDTGSYGTISAQLDDIEEKLFTAKVTKETPEKPETEAEDTKETPERTEPEPKETLERTEPEDTKPKETPEKTEREDTKPKETPKKTEPEDKRPKPTPEKLEISRADILALCKSSEHQGSAPITSDYTKLNREKKKKKGGKADEDDTDGPKKKKRKRKRKKTTAATPRKRKKTTAATPRKTRWTSTKPTTTPEKTEASQVTIFFF